MRSNTFRLRPLAPFGVELMLDLSRPLSSPEGQALRNLFYREKLILLRGQTLSEDRHAEALAHIGPVLGSRGEYREISSDGNLGSGPLCWHSDLAFTPAPFIGLSLYAMAVKPGQSATLFANGIRALQHMPAALVDRLSRMEAVSLISAVQTHRDIPFSAPDFFPQIARPAIIPHPETGEPVLYISEMQTARIGDLDKVEGDRFLEQVFTYLYAPNDVYEHRWRDGDLIIWDNLALQHSRPDLTDHKPRRLRRIALAEQSFYDLCPQFDINDPRVVAWGNGDVHALDEVAGTA